MNDPGNALRLALAGLVATLAHPAAAAPPPAAPAEEGVQAISPLYGKVVAGWPDPVLVLDTTGAPHVVYYEAVNTPLGSRLEFALRYTYLDGTIVRSFRIPATGFFTTTCVLQTGTQCFPHLSPPRIVMDSQKRAHIVAQGSDSYDQTTNTSTAQIVNVTCPAGVACSSPTQVAIYQGLCDLGLPRGGKCPPPPPRAELAIFNDQLYLKYGSSLTYHVESTTIHWVTASKAAAGTSWSTIFQYDSIVTDTLPLEGYEY